MQVHYYRHPDGSVSMRETTDGVTVVTPEGATEITQAEYEAELAALKAAHAEAAAAAAAAEEAARRENYLALIALGMPEESARRMSGYTGPSGDDS